MDCEIYLVGLNHRTAGVDVRERFALTNYCDPENWALPCEGSVNEAFILSTCNRVELLATGCGEVSDQMLDRWAKVCGSCSDDLRPYVYIYKDLEAVRHLFTVAASLDSMVLGEPQILGQLKSAYRKASDCHVTGVILNRLLHKAFSVAKRVRTETAVASSAVSISYAAVELAKRIFGEMHSHKAMLIGAGEMAELAATHLLQAGIQDILVANRTFERGQELAKGFKGQAIHFEKLVEYLPQVDIIITSTGSTEPIIRARDIRSVLKARKNRPMFFIDIAVPRDIDPDVNALDNVYLYDIDDLKEVVEENLANRREEASKAADIVDEEVDSFSVWLDNLSVQPTIVDLIQRGENLARTELARTLKYLGPLDTDSLQALETMLLALVRKLNHAPITFLKGNELSHVQTPARISLIRRIFDLENHVCKRNNGD